jgi:hypothetical protein
MWEEAFESVSDEVEARIEEFTRQREEPLDRKASADRERSRYQVSAAPASRLEKETTMDGLRTENFETNGSELSEPLIIHEHPRQSRTYIFPSAAQSRLSKEGHLSKCSPIASIKSRPPIRPGVCSI